MYSYDILGCIVRYTSHEGSVTSFRICQGGLDLSLPLLVSEDSHDLVVFIKVILPLIGITRPKGYVGKNPVVIIPHSHSAPAHYVIFELAWRLQEND